MALSLASAGRSFLFVRSPVAPKMTIVVAGGLLLCIYPLAG
jgi:hypothetical protein